MTGMLPCLVLPATIIAISGTKQKIKNIIQRSTKRNVIFHWIVQIEICLKNGKHSRCQKKEKEERHLSALLGPCVRTLKQENLVAAAAAQVCRGHSCFTTFSTLLRRVVISQHKSIWLTVMLTVKQWAQERPTALFDCLRRVFVLG